MGEVYSFQEKLRTLKEGYEKFFRDDPSLAAFASLGENIKK